MLRRGETGDWVGTFEGHKGAVWAAALDDAALLAATGSADFSARVWNAVTGDLMHEFAHKHIVRAVAFSHGASSTVLGERPDGSADGGADGSADGGAPETRVRSGDGAEPGAGAGADGAPSASSLPSSSDALPPPSYAPAGSAPLLATAGPEKLIRLFDLSRADAAPQTLREARSGVRRLAWSGDDRVLLASYMDGAGLDLWDVRTGGVARTVETPRPILDLSPSPGGDVFALSDESNVIVLDRLEVVRTFSPQGCHKVESAALSLSKNLIAAGGADMWVHLYDYATGELLGSGKGHHGPVHVLRFAPDQESLASGSEDGTIRIWSVANARADAANKDVGDGDQTKNKQRDDDKDDENDKTKQDGGDDQHE